MLTGLTLANGTGWSPDGATMYHFDSRTERIRHCGSQFREPPQAGSDRLNAT